MFKLYYKSILKKIFIGDQKNVQKCCSLYFIKQMYSKLFAHGVNFIPERNVKEKPGFGLTG